MVNEVGEKDGKDGMMSGRGGVSAAKGGMTTGRDKKTIEEGDKIIAATTDKSEKPAKAKERKEIWGLRNIRAHPPTLQAVLDTACHPLRRLISHTHPQGTKDRYHRHTNTRQNPTRINKSAKKATVKEE